MVGVSFPDFQRLKILGEGYQTSSRTTRLVCGLLVVSTFMCYTLLWNTRYLETNRSTSRTRKILLWTTFFNREDYYFGLGKTPFIEHNCEVRDCEMTTNKNEVNTSDAVVFHIRNFNGVHLPSFRQPIQRWVFFLLESPVNTWLDLQYYANVFNWTMTYRKDSDIYIPYGSFDQIQQDVQPYDIGAASKSKMILWLVSNCHTHSHRELYITNLKKHIPVDIRGRCGQPCNITHPCGSLEKDYKFAISFENSICLDYVTEKFFRTLKNGAVPIVYGGAGHAPIAPPHSYIDADKFSSPKEMSDYLWVLHRNNSLYNEYHKWRQNYSITTKGIHSGFCDLCSKLHSEDGTVKTYPNIKKWWMEQGRCKPIPNIL